LKLFILDSASEYNEDIFPVLSGYLYIWRVKGDVE